MKVVNEGTQFTDRISVNGTGATGEIVLTISNVELKDDLEFICLIKGLTEGTGEGRTKMKVFGKIQAEMFLFFNGLSNKEKHTKSTNTQNR